MSDGKNECGIYPVGNKSDPYHLGNVYGGIPTNLITNTLGWLVLMVMFILIRKSAFKYLKLESLGDLLTNTERSMNRLIKVFFSSSDQDNEEVIENVKSHPTSARDPTTIDTDVEVGDGVTAVNESVGSNGGSFSVTNNSYNLLKTRKQELLKQNCKLKDGPSFWFWLFQSIAFSNDTMLKLAGPDAVQYLKFQKYLIWFVLLTMILSICIILPFNFQGTLQGTTIDFGHTTLANLSADDDYLYVHLVIAFVLFPISIFLMRRFSVGLNFRDVSTEITRILQIENIPHHMCREKLLRTHFKEAYPDIELKDVKVVFDVEELTSVARELKDASDARKYGEMYKAKHNKDLEMYPYCAARCCFWLCCCFVNKVKVIDFYKSEEQRLTREVERQKEFALNKPLGMAFVTFPSLNASKTVYEDHSTAFWSSSRPPMSSLTTFRSDKWVVHFAPPPRDIYWENLADNRRWLWIKIFVSNLCLFLVALFLTTPEYIVSQLEPIILALTNNTVKIPTYVKDFIPTLLLWSFTALMPVLVAYSVRWLGFWYRSEENHSIMRKSFWYLWIMVIIFPTFGFTTGLALLENLFAPTNTTDPNPEPIIRWECIFLPDSGAFFVNYVITAALIGSGLELIRFPELFWYALQVCLSRSEADTRAIQRAVEYEFRFGEQYARMLLLFAMVVMYSISCPLITPFGLLYFVLKHLVDKHNLALVYAPSKINKSVHRSAINFVIFCVTLLQVFMASFSFIRSWNGTPNDLTTRTKLSLLLLFLSIIIFSAQIWSDFCKRMSPIKYVDVLFIDDETDDEHDEQYIPEVLLPCYPKLEAEMKAHDSMENEFLSDDSQVSGTFEKDLITVEVEIVDVEKLITID